MMDEPLDALWDFGDPVESERRFRARLDASDATGDESAEILTQLARSQGLQGRFEDAHATLNVADSQMGNNDSVARIRSLLERGRTCNSSGDVAGAKPLFLRAWQMALDNGEEFYAVDAAHMLGIVEDVESQVTWSTSALAMAERSDQPRVRTWLGPLYNNLGWTYHDLGKFEEALALFQRSLVWRTEQKQPREARIAAWSVARCLRSLGRFDEALAMQMENLGRADAKGGDVGTVHEEIGECLLALERGNEAQPHFAAAYAAVQQDEWALEHEPDRVQRLQALGHAEDDRLVRLRGICLSLPLATERMSHGEPAWFVDGKRLFVMFADRHHNGHVAFWCAAPAAAQETLVQADPEHYFVPPYVGHRGWLGVYLDVEVDWDEIKAIVTDGYRVVAPKRLAALVG